MTINGDKSVLHRVGIIMLFLLLLLFKTGLSNGGFAIKAALVTQVTYIIEIYRSCFVLFLFVILV